MPHEGFDKLDEYIVGNPDAACSKVYLQHALHPQNASHMEDANGFALTYTHDDSAMEIWLKVSDEIITCATFWTDGCGNTIACGSMLTEMVRGKTIGEALDITPVELADALGGLPGDGCTCAELAVNTLQQAVRDYLAFKNEPWRRKYTRQTPG